MVGENTDLQPQANRADSTASCLKCTWVTLAFQAADHPVSSLHAPEYMVCTRVVNFLRLTRCRFSFLALLLLGNLLPSALFAGPGSPRSGFSQNILGDVYSVVEQPDGKILAAGNLFYVNSAFFSYLVRYHPDGSLDTSFQAASPNYTITSVIIDSEGRIYIAGGFTAVALQPRSGIARLLPDGSLDSSFTPQLEAGFVGSCMALLADGNLLVGSTDLGIRKISPAGVVDTSYSVTMTGTPNTLCPLVGGKVVVGGSFTMLNGSPAGNLGLLLPDGTRDINWSPYTNDTVYTIVQDYQGDFLIGGAFTSLGGVGQTRLAKFMPTGEKVVSFNPAPNSSVHSLIPLANGQILAGGYFTSAGGASRTGVVCLNPSGTANTAWQDTGMSSVLALCLRKSGDLLVGRVRSVNSASNPAGAYLFNPSLHCFEGDSFTSVLQQESPGLVTWNRTGFAAIVLHATLDSSTDQGATWVPLGAMSGIGAVYQANVTPLADGTWLRAKGHAVTGYRSTSGHWVHEYAVAGVAAPEVRVTIEGGSELTDATGSQAFATATQTKRLIIENTGTAPLVLGTPRLSSLTAFRLGLQSFQTLVAPGGSTTVDIEYTPPVSDTPYTAAFFLPSNDQDEAVFDVALSGASTLSTRAALDRIELNWTAPGTGTVVREHVNIGYHSEWLTYTMDIPADLVTARVKLVPEFDEQGNHHPMRYTVNGTLIPAGNYEPQVTLSRAATQQLTIVATAGDGVTTRTYQITLNREAPEAGDVNLSFQPPQSNAFDVTVIAPQPDGHFMLSGGFSSMGGQPRLGMAKITSQGEVVNGFVPDQAVITSFQTAQNGSMLAAGDRYGSQRGYARILISGQRDPGLPSFAGPNFSQFAAILPDGDGFLMSGSFSVLNEPASYALCRFGWDGRRDVTFTPSSPAYPSWAMAKLPDGRLLVSRAWASGMGLFVQNRFGDSVAVHGVTGSALCILPLPEGGFLLGGSLVRSGATPLVRLKPDLTPDTAFNVSAVLQGMPKTLALQADGKILVGGCSMMTAGPGRVRSTHVVRLLPDGQQDTSFSTEVEGTSLPVSSLTLRKDGQLLVGGRFTAINGVADATLALLQNDPATESLELTSREQVTWLRGGSSPEAMRTQFSLSRDGGSTWTDLGAGQRISGGWQVTGLSLPAAGRIRAHAHISVGANNASSGIIESTLDYNDAGEEITVLDSGAQNLNAGATLDFGQIGTSLGAKSAVTITVRNDGSADLTGLAAALSGAAQADFTIQSPLPATLAPGASAELALIFSPKTLGSRQAAVTLHSSDGDEPTITFVLQGTGVASSVFTVVTGATKQVTAGSAVLQGTAKANGISRQLFFDYGPTAALGQIVAATPDTATGTGTATTNASAALTGLRPGFTYYYRLRGESSFGNATGTTRTFRTLASPIPAGIQVSGTTQAPPEGADLILEVTAPEQAWWAVTGLPAWITTTLPASPGSANLVLKVLPNPGAVARQVKLVVGGVAVTITQTAVSAKPVITPADRGYRVKANDTFAQQITVTGQPATLSVKGLPPGLTFSPDGWVRGHFDKEGKFTATITAKNGRGTTTVTWGFEVEPSGVLRYYAPGSYIALIPRDPALNRNLASRLDLTVTTTGGYSGKLTTGASAVPFAGRLVMNTDSTDLAATLPVPGGPLELTGAFQNYSNHPLRLRLQTTDGSRVYFFLASKASPTFTYSANFAFTHARDDLDVPFGSGYLACAATKTSKDMVLCTGRLGDGTVLTFSTPLTSPLCLYYSLPMDGGTLAGTYLQGAASNTATWLKLPPVKPLPQDAYASGFGPVDLTIQGGTPATMTKGSIRPGASAVLSFSHSPLNLTETSFTVPFQIVNPSAAGVTNTAKFTATTNPNTVAMPTYNPVTGAFTGTFTLKGATTAANRKVTFQGLLVPVGAGFVGHGYFMLPASTVKNALQTSGRVSITVAP